MMTFALPFDPARPPNRKTMKNESSASPATVTELSATTTRRTTMTIPQRWRPSREPASNRSRRLVRAQQARSLYVAKGQTDGGWTRRQRAGKQNITLASELDAPASSNRFSFPLFLPCTLQHSTAFAHTSFSCGCGFDRWQERGPTAKLHHAGPRFWPGGRCAPSHQCYCLIIFSLAALCSPRPP